MSSYDIYTEIHKALRNMLYELGTGLERNDFTEERATGDILANLQHRLELFTEHAFDEEKYVHPELRAFEPELVVKLESDHEMIERNGDVVKEIMGEFEEENGREELIEAGISLNHAFNDYMAFFLTHLNYEEATALPALWRNFTDEQIMKMRADIIDNSAPERNAEFAMGMFAILNNQEMAELIGGMKAAPMPPEAIEALMGLARNTVGEERWQVIQGFVGAQVTGK